MLILKWIYAPAFLVGFNAAAIIVVAAGLPHWMLGPLFAAALWCSFSLERRIPYQKAWNKPMSDRWRDLAHFVVNETANIVSILCLPVIAAWIPWQGFWPSKEPIWTQLLLAVITADFGITIAHYFSHRWKLLWRFHAVHHSVKRMYGFNGLMKHPLHQGVEMLAGTAPLVVAGIPQDIAFLLAFAIGIQLLLQHSNVDMRLGPFKYLLALAPIHRFHHLKDAAEGDVNFGLFTTFWDRLLGTAYYDKSRSFSSNDLGIGDQPNYPTSYLWQLVKPFLRQGR